MFNSVSKESFNERRVGMIRYRRHQEFKRNCGKLDRSYGSDWNTCRHAGNPTAINICSPEHCPRKGMRDATFDLRHGNDGITQGL